MFDCLQEGIVVIEENHRFGEEYEVLFCNEIATRITSKALNTSIKDELFD